MSTVRTGEQISLLEREVRRQRQKARRIALRLVPGNKDVRGRSR